MATDDSKKYVGMWVRPNGQIRQELQANGRYDEARGDKQSAYQGRYEMNGNHIQYWDDTGFTADGDFIDGVLHHIGMKFHREYKVSWQCNPGRSIVEAASTAN